MGYVLGVLFFLGAIFYFIAVVFVNGAGTIVKMIKSNTYQNFTIDRINIAEETLVNNYIRSDQGLTTTLFELSQKLGHNAYFKYDHLLTLPRERQEQMAADYLLSKKGYTSREMAEMGCYRIPENSPKIAQDAMLDYMHLIQDNIKDKTGTSIWMKEGHWVANKKWGKTRNYKWVDSPADKSWWDAGKNITSGYKCVYRKNSP